MTKYLVKQPTSKLENLAIVKLAAWTALQGKKCMIRIWDLQDDANRAEALLRHNELLQKYFDRHLPKKFHDALLSKTMTELLFIYKRTEYENSLHKINSQKNIIQHMIEPLLTKKLTRLSLDLNLFTTFRVSLLSKSYLLTGLTRLDLIFESTDGGDLTSNTAIVNNIIHLLKQLYSLKYVTISYICTDDILKCIVNNCKLVEELNIHSSNQINDKSMDILKSLYYLRSINLENTSVREKGIEILLLFCTNIEHIVIPYIKYDNYNISNRIPDTFINVLKGIANSTEKFPKLFRIKTYKSNRDTVEELELLVQMCPLIQKLYFYQTYLYGRNRSLMAITGLKGLRDLTVEECSYYTDKVNTALQVIGCNLVHLHLIRVKYIDMNAIVNIGELCPNLLSLSLENCAIFFGTPEELKIQPNSIFLNLKSVILDTSGSFDAIPREDLYEPQGFDQVYQLIQKIAVSLLSDCLDVEFIQLSKSKWLTEDLMFDILDKNPFRHLKELKIRKYQLHSPIRNMPQSITTSVIERIINNSIYHPLIIEEKRAN